MLDILTKRATAFRTKAMPMAVSSRPGNSEIIRIQNPAAGAYCIKLIGVKAFNNVTSQARY